MTMHATFHSLVLLATTWLGTSLDAAMMPVGADRIDIEASGNIIAVFIEGQVAVDQVVDRLGEPGITASHLEPSSVPGWFYVDVSGLAADDGERAVVASFVCAAQASKLRADACKVRILILGA